MTAHIEIIEASDAASVDTARRIIAAAESHDGSSPVSDQALLAVSQGQRALVLFADQAQADQQATAQQASAAPVVAVGVVGQGEVDLAVHPSARGRGIGSAALAALLVRAAEQLTTAAEPATQGKGAELLAWAHGENPAAEALLSHAGFTPVRSLFRMALDPAFLPHDARDPLALPTPDGLTLRAFDAERPGDAAAWVSANAAAFASHPEQGRITVADFELMQREPWFDPADLILLDASLPGSADTVLAGSTWIKTVAVEAAATDDGAGAVECELYAVGIRPEYAGRGLGKLLLDATLARMAQHAPSRVTLYVDGENETAVRLYERASFTVDSRSRQWSNARIGL